MVARVRGTGEAAPLLLNAHLDVVEADAARWRHDPFGGEIHDGYLWGRGAIDMKHMAAMSACVMSLLARQAKDGKKLGEGKADLLPPDDKGRMVYLGEYPLASFPPGTYEARVRVKQGASTAEDKATITIVP